MKKPYLEIRTRKNKLDEIVLENIDSVHIEDMDGKTWWFGVYSGEKRITFYIHSKSKIDVKLVEQDLPVKWVEQEHEI